MLHARKSLSEHRRFFIVAALLTLVMTFPAGLHVFNNEDFWFPTRNFDVFMKIWDSWYIWRQVAAPADLSFTDLLFYPQGISLVYHNFSLPHIVVHGFLASLMPVSNAYTLTYLLLIFAVACSTYLYLYYLLQDKSAATLGAVIVALSPFVVNQAEHVEIQMIAPIPLSLYFFHRGAAERRYRLLLVSALVVGATSLSGLYIFLCLSLMFAMYCMYFTALRWRDKNYWIALGLCALIIVAVSAPRILPMLHNAQGLEEALRKMENRETVNDLAEYIYNSDNPFTGAFLGNALGLEDVATIKHNWAFIGFVIPILVAVGALHKPNRRKMLPWLFLMTAFVLLRLGSMLTIAGQQYHDLLLPKHYLDELAPILTKGFYITSTFHSGALLPLAVLAGYGALTLVRSMDGRRRTAAIGLCIALVCFEYFSESDPGIVSKKNLDHLQWLDEEPGEKRLINQPMGGLRSKWYNFLHSQSGYPQAEGRVARPPSAANDYLNANYLLKSWQRKLYVKCEGSAYLVSLAQLEQDGFSHLVYHKRFLDDEAMKDGVPGVEPAYEDEFVAIYRLNDLREGCPPGINDQYPVTLAYFDAMKRLSMLDELRGTAVLFPSTPESGADIIHYLRRFLALDWDVVTITSAEQPTVEIQRSTPRESNSIIDLDLFAAVWLVNRPLDWDAEQSVAFRSWFTEQFSFCERSFEDERTTIDLYMRADLPCTALQEESAFEVRYDSGVMLHNASLQVRAETIHFYLSWTNHTSSRVGFSIQFFDENGAKALQYDNVIYDQLLSTHEIDASSLLEGAYSIKLIVYDYGTQASQDGVIAGAGERFERELELASIEL